MVPDLLVPQKVLLGTVHRLQVLHLWSAELVEEAQKARRAVRKSLHHATPSIPFSHRHLLFFLSLMVAPP